MTASVYHSSGSWSVSLSATWVSCVELPKGPLSSDESFWNMPWFQLIFWLRSVALTFLLNINWLYKCKIDISFSISYRHSKLNSVQSWSFSHIYFLFCRVLSVYLYLSIYSPIYPFICHSDGDFLQGKNRERERARVPICWAYSPKAHNGLSWQRQNWGLESRCFIWVPRTQPLQPSLLPHRVCIWKPKSGNGVRDPMSSSLL